MADDYAFRRISDQQRRDEFVELQRQLPGMKNAAAVNRIKKSDKLPVTGNNPAQIYYSKGTPGDGK